MARPYVIALVLAGILAAAFAAAGHFYGWHSTPAFWAMGINLPGFIIAVWMALLTHHEDLTLFDCVVIVLSNWGFYSLVIWGVRRLKRYWVSS